MSEQQPRATSTSVPAHPPAIRAPRAVLFAPVIVLVAVLVAAGCGGIGGTDGADGSGIAGEDGPLAWLPADAWLVGGGDLGAERIDEAIATLDRLPSWALAEAFLPVEDGAGLRREGFRRLLAQGELDGVSEQELEDALGDRFGFAVTGTDLDALESEDAAAPVVAWVEVDDEDAFSELLESDDVESEAAEHEGVEYHVVREQTGSGDGAGDADPVEDAQAGNAVDEAPGGGIRDHGAAVLVQDGLAVITVGAPALEALIDLHEDGDSLADDETARAVFEVGLADQLFGVAVASDPLLAAAPELLDDELGEADRERLATFLERDAVDDAVPAWMTYALTIDGSGLRLRGTWSDARDIVDAELGARELLERMPASALTSSALLMDDAWLVRAREVWAEARDAWELDLREAADAECEPRYAWACALGVEAALAVLEHEAILDVDALDEPQASAIASTLPAVTADGTPTTSDVERIYDSATTAPFPEYDAPEELREAAAAAGLEVTSDPDELTTTVRITPDSPLAAELQRLRRTEPEFGPTLATMGIELDELSAGGWKLTSEEVDDLLVSGWPQGSESQVARSLAGKVDELGEYDRYRAAVDAVEVPEQVGVVGWLNVQAFADYMFEVLAKTAPESGRVAPTVRNNLDAIPGVLSWTTREEVDGHQVGVADVAIPIVDD